MEYHFTKYIIIILHPVLSDVCLLLFTSFPHHNHPASVLNIWTGCMTLLTLTFRIKKLAYTGKELRVHHYQAATQALLQNAMYLDRLL